MSRTRIIKGKLIEIIGKDYSIFSESSIVYNATETINIKGEDKGVSHNMPLKTNVLEQDIGECIVEFRPRIPNYGKFGFDFMRVGDNIGSGVHDITYLGNMGTYAQNNYNNTFSADASPFNKFKGLNTAEFNPLNISVSEFRKANVREKYAVPWLSLYRIPAGRLLVDGTPDPEADSCIAATLKLFIEVKTEPDELRLQFDDRYFSIIGNGGTTTKAETTKPNTSYFSIPSKTPTIASGTAGTPHTMDIEINCIKEFGSIMSIKAFAVTKDAAANTTVENLSGKLLIKPNNKANRKYQKIVLVNVKTSLAPSGGNLTGQEDVLKHALRQALIDPRIKNIELPCTGADFNPYLHTAPTPPGSTTAPPQVIKGYYEYDYANSRENTHKPRVWKDIEDYLNAKLVAQEGNRYNSYIKVYYFGSQGGYIKVDGTWKVLNGYSATGQKTTVLFHGYDVNATTSHEVLHSMGLDHTFENKNIIPRGMTRTNAPNGKYTFKQGITDNILDYASGRKSLMEWQWDIIRASAQSEP